MYIHPPEEKKDTDSHALLYIGKKKDDSTHLVAWICVDTNLYLACGKRNLDASGWHGNENWAYLNVDGKGKPFQMNDCIRLLDPAKEIRIGDLLSDINEEEV